MLSLIDFILFIHSTTTTATAWTSAVSVTQVSSLLTPCLEVEPQVRESYGSQHIPVALISCHSFM